MARYDVVVIGAGLGGLTTGAILARAGRKVLVIERSNSVGGAASSYKSGDLFVEGSLHETSDPHHPRDPKHSVLTRMEELIHHFINVTQGVNVPPGEVYFGHENPKGELGFYIYSKGGGTPHRLKIRAPSFVTLSILPKLLPGHMVSDVVAILGSFDFVMGECDR